jgi:RNA polymerase subunit RPABC4/transcription elongation factor Spt4
VAVRRCPVGARKGRGCVVPVLELSAPDGATAVFTSSTSQHKVDLLVGLTQVWVAGPVADRHVVVAPPGGAELLLVRRSRPGWVNAHDGSFTNGIALVACRGCGRQVSDSADSCPHCGTRQPGGQKPRLSNVELVASFLGRAACRGCGRWVSDSAESCPHCGISRPGQKRLGAVQMVLLILVVIAGYVALYLNSVSLSR